MVHPKPNDAEREALYGYFIGRDVDADKLPEIVKSFERFKANGAGELPNVPFQMLTALPLNQTHWKEIARNAGWTMTRMNLNTFSRHGVLADAEMVGLIANRLRDAEAIRRSKVFPFQLLSAFQAANANAQMPREITEALQDAMETAIENVPEIAGKVYVFPDVSGSMHSPATGYRPGATSQVKCIDIAALVAAAILRKNPTAEILPFSDRLNEIRLNPRDSVMTNAERLSTLPSGGTNCSLPLAKLNRQSATGDVLIYVSDNESWIDSNRSWNRGTDTMTEWNQFKTRNRNAKLVCLDIQPNASTQAQERADILNIGGFSDTVFDVVSEFSKGTLNAEHWVGVIEKVEI